jgi:hypothetical protein
LWVNVSKQYDKAVDLELQQMWQLISMKSVDHLQTNPIALEVM